MARPRKYSQDKNIIKSGRHSEKEVGDILEEFSTYQDFIEWSLNAFYLFKMKGFQFASKSLNGKSKKGAL